MLLASRVYASQALLVYYQNQLVEAQDIDKVEAVVNKISYDNLMFPVPASEMEARFSMEYAIALALTRGRLRISDF